MTACSNVSARRVRPEHTEHAVDVSLDEDRHGRTSAQRRNRLMEPAFALGGRSKRVLAEPFQLRELFHSLALLGPRGALAFAPAVNRFPIDTERLADFGIGHLQFALNPSKRRAGKLHFELSSRHWGSSSDKSTPRYLSRQMPLSVPGCRNV